MWVRLWNSPDNVESIPLFTARSYEKNTVISLFQKVRMLDLLQKKLTILDLGQFCERFYFFAKTVR
ncbi:hypothetical protein LEP1GSC043_0107 [Leptospira weilii str. Ecochallenge]|uniref:Uncharacterized protein n=1 Tax=Leptospira weilii str. Ecochallenge TaxID=1049986 RepID=N1U7I7_9LEPT|nr:hypothetical protein LEP1GSC043_0107 [Leptospira weilii str. Ecochallenge]